MLFLQVLEELETSEPAEYVFERIRQRLEHAVERDQEERHAARTKESINLAEYPDSFEVASRWRAASSPCSARPIPARPTARWKHLAQAGSGVYLAPLRLLALENYERLQGVTPKTASRWPSA
jgi:ATP-dependent RNA helicase SUPV3L1/SUV3